MCKSWCQPFNLGEHHYFDFKGQGSWVEFLAASCFVFVIILLFKSHKWVRFSFFVCLFCFVLCCFSFKVFDFPTTYLGSGCCFSFFFFFLSRRLVKFFAFFHFCLFFILFCFVFCFCFCFFLFFCFRKFHPLDIKWCALILILLHRWWWTLRHRQFWIPVQFSEKSNSNLKLH